MIKGLNELFSAQQKIEVLDRMSADENSAVPKAIKRLIPLMPGSPHLVRRSLRGDAGLSLLGHVSERMQAGERRSAIFGSWDQAR